MCGIAGYYGFKKDESLLKAMNNAQAHRGPDGEGYFTDENIGLAHVRLAIIDRAHGKQPLYNKDRTLSVVFNGEIYNYLELKDELEQAGYKFATNSDTEVIVHAYAAWGEEAFDRFNGMFAFALYDKSAQKLLLVRDHFGIKPLYFANLGDVKKPQILFASEIKALLATKKVEKKPNDRVIYRYLKFRIHEDSDQTFFDGINKLMPGEMMAISKDGAQISRYTRLDEELVEQSLKNQDYDQQSVDEYHRRLTDAIKIRLQSEVPVGTSFSGGLDSSTVVAVVNSLMKQDAKSTDSVGKMQNTFSAVFPNSANDEEAYVDELLNRCKNTVAEHKIKPNADEFADDLEDFVRTQEEPLISTGPYAQYKVMQEATNYVTVLLDGQGADETMAGYVPYYFVYLRQLKNYKKWGKLFVEIVSSLDIFLRFARVNLMAKILRKKPISAASLIDYKFRGKFSEEKFDVVGDNLKMRLIDDIFYHSLPSLLRYEDKNTMRFSLEGRVPFLDKDVVKYLFALNDDAIIKNGWNKRILREATNGLLPEMINKRRNKIGFTTPEHEWFMRLKNRFYSVFLSESFANRPYFNQQAILEAFEGFIKGNNDTNSLLFWRFLNVELWLREFFDEKPEEIPVHHKKDTEPNEGKKLDIAVDGHDYARYCLRTELVTANDNLQDFITGRLQVFYDHLLNGHKKHAELLQTKEWYLFVSEKIVAITQGRSYFIWDIKPGWWARALSRRVTKTPYGIGLGSPWTMQLAIQEVGLFKILYASIGGVIGKAFGKRGVFYNLVGSDIRAIDGPTEYSAYPSNVSAKLAPKDPDAVAEGLAQAMKNALPKEMTANFMGVVVIDSNDIGRNVLGKNVKHADKLFEDIFADNPLGQACEQTPIAVVVKK
ncbi:MAG: asparagine synthase (glutamine-hydrolyzing) [Candidatus Woesebacteria bacterium]|jgi:asparagine synthase (glutamine-hydrolysing)